MPVSVWWFVHSSLSLLSDKVGAWSLLRNYKLVVSARVVESERSQLTVDLVGRHINVRVNDIILASKLTYYVRIMLNAYAHQYAHFISGIISAPLINTSNKNFILKYFRCTDRKRTETRKGMEGISITHSCIPLYTVYLQHIIRDCGSNLYVAMRVVEMFWQYNRQGWKGMWFVGLANKMNIHWKPWPSWVQICPLISAQLYRSWVKEFWKNRKLSFSFFFFFFFFFLLLLLLLQWG